MKTRLANGGLGTMAWEWLPAAAAGGVVGLLSSGLYALMGWRVTSAEKQGGDEARLSALGGKLDTMENSWTAGIERVQKLSDNITGLQASQNQVNAFTAKALDAVTEKMDRHDAAIADLQSTVKLLTALVMKGEARA